MAVVGEFWRCEDVGAVVGTGEASEQGAWG